MKTNRLFNNFQKLAAVVTLSCLFFAKAASAAKSDDLEWTDAFWIEHEYASVSHNMVLMQNASNNNEIEFEALTPFDETDHIHDEISWILEIVPNTKYFKIKNVNTLKYMVRNADDNSIEMSSTLDPDSENNYQWFVEPINSKNEVLFFNRGAGESKALKYNDENGSAAASLSLSSIASFYDTSFYFSLTDRYLNTHLLPSDLDKNSGLLHLDNGIAINSFITPAPNPEHQGTVTRRLKMDITDVGDRHYQFIDSVGFDVTGMDRPDEQHRIQKSLILQIVAIYQSWKGTEDEVEFSDLYDAVTTQLSEAFNNNNSPATIVWLPGSYEQVTADIAAGDFAYSYQLIDPTADTYFENTQPTNHSSTLAVKLEFNSELNRHYRFLLMTMYTNVAGQLDIHIIDPDDASDTVDPSP